MGLRPTKVLTIHSRRCCLQDNTGTAPKDNTGTAPKSTSVVLCSTSHTALDDQSSHLFVSELSQVRLLGMGQKSRRRARRASTHKITPLKPCKYRLERKTP